MFRTKHNYHSDFGAPYADDGRQSAASRRSGCEGKQAKVSACFPIITLHGHRRPRLYRVENLA